MTNVPCMMKLVFGRRHLYLSVTSIILAAPQILSTTALTAFTDFDIILHSGVFRGGYTRIELETLNIAYSTSSDAFFAM